MSVVLIALSNCAQVLGIDDAQRSEPDAGEPAPPDAVPKCEASDDCSGAEPFCDVDSGDCTADCTVVSDEQDVRDESCAAASTDTPRCSAGVGVCVACLDSSDCTGNVNGSVCEIEPGAGQYSCRGCSADSECDTQVCKLADEDEFGACASADEVLYVSKRDGVGGADCSLETPCEEIGEALAIAASAGAKRYIRILDEGNYAEQLILDGDMDVSIVGHGGLIGLSEGVPVIDVSENASVELREVTVRGAADGAGGIRCISGGTAQVKLRDVTVRTGINGGVGLTAAQCVLDIVRSEFRGNGGGAIDILLSEFVIFNSLIEGNGRDDSPFGGIQIGNVTLLETVVQVIAFTTIVANTSSTTATASGIYCFGKASDPVIAHSNIVRGGDSAAALIDGSNCTFTHSNIEGLESLRDSLPDMLDDASNVDGEPLFTDAANGDYSLLPADTSCTNQGKPDTGVTSDINGAARPQGGANPDIGAYEVSEAGS
ncbi:MAG: hypothetical protein Tsb0020_12990 [Haliangiales bacterium]